jgi:muramoyltetrapeptide carboxypeptidase
LLSRRNILKALTTVPFLIGINNLSAKEIAESAPIKSLIETGNQVTIPKAISPNSKIAITAPASPASLGEVAPIVNIFKKMGCQVVVGDTVAKQRKSSSYLSATDEERAKELMSFFEDKDVSAIIAARGGYGVTRILDKLDYNIIKENPKILVGFSDITALILAIFKKCSLVTYHGPVASSEMNSLTKDSFFKTLVSDFVKMPYSITIPEMTSINKGIALGRLTGGNLTMVCNTLGTEYEIETDGAIFFLEETKEEPYKIDRMLTHLHLAGKFSKCNAVLLGNFDYLNSRRNFFPGRSLTGLEILNDRFKDIGIPVVYGMPFGHMKNKLTLPVGISAKIDTEKKIFALIEPAVS